MADLVTLKKKRAYIKGSMTKLLNYVTGIGSGTNVEDIKVRLANVERYRTEFMAIETKILTLDHAEELDVDFEENYYKLVAGLNSALRSKLEPTISLNDTMIDASISGPHIDVRLPKISIPFFAGDYTEWQSFHDLFCSTIHDNARLTPSQKLQYLKGTLKGEAAGLLKHFSITDANYIEAIKKLRDRYDRKKHTINAFIKNFMSQPALTVSNCTNVRRLLDTSDEIIRGLKALGADAESRDHWLIYIMISKLDEETNSAWAQTSAEYDSPTLQQFFDFLSKRIDALESLKGANRRAYSQAATPKVIVKSHAISSPLQPCTLCPEEQHKLFECGKFNGMSGDERRILLQKEQRCFNCLNINYSVYACKSKFRCKHCNKKHHSLLHGTFPNSASNSAISTIQSSETASSSYTITTTKTHIRNSILPTALVYVADGSHGKQLCRVLLDSGSQGSFITENCLRRLGLKRSNAKLAISGIGAAINGYTKGVVSLTITPWNNDQPSFQIDAFVFPMLTAKQSPNSQFIDLNYFKQYQLADPHFYKGADIDIIIGADTFFELLSIGKVVTKEKLIMQKTLLGWVIAGKPDESQSKLSIAVNITPHGDELENLLRKFWEIETLQLKSPNLNKEEELCEKSFDQTMQVDSSGRFVVRLPFKVSPSVLGDSFRLAAQRMHSMEKRFLRDNEFAAEYKQFMSEYLQLGHMKEIDNNSVNSNGYHLPHHGVVKRSSSTTKLRVVFDGSASTTTGKSLNDCLAVGPIVQSSLYDILVRFRIYKVAFTADVEKMYRQVRIAVDDTKYQRIIWRDSPEKPFTTYELQTVTYGTASATYLATRALNEAAEKYKNIQPIAVSHIKSNMYVDDLMTGADSIDDSIILKNQIDSILSNSGFQLRKWLASDAKVLTDTSNPSKVLEIEESNSFIKVLGLYWNPKTDHFQFKVQLNDKPTITKRGILSEASRLFDPLGWLAPVTITVKIFFQTLWTEKLSWDEILPQNLSDEWLKVRENLHTLENIKISRYINTTQSGNVTLHGFSDASKYAYSAVVYAQVTASDGKSIVNLISAKTKVAPVKQISIPRLELCGAVLLSKLLQTVKHALKIDISNIIAWTDSTIVLDWLSSHPTKWSTFVGNRTGEILTTMNRCQWRHVDSLDNPADCASRGTTSEKLQDFELWWHGPKWLANPEMWPIDIKSQTCTSEEMRTQSLHIQTSQANILDNLIENMSSFSKMIRVLAYVFRFIDIKLKNIQKESLSPFLLASELKKPRNLIFMHIQNKNFQNDINQMTSNKELSSSSKLKFLKPFIDKSGVLRVGGRLSNASITYEVKHPIILSANEKLTEMIVREHHIRYLHAGPTLMMATLRQRYWILGGRNLIRKTISRCVECTKYNRKQLNQVMGNLPNPRVELVRPFFKVGVDYAGPFQTHLVRGRGQKTYKSYVCIFVCLATKAVHIELVSNLTTEAYVAALRRFVARRGIGQEIHSDNGTNFIGARNHLYELYKFLRQNSNTISKFLLADEITFKFIPPSSPHFGGLWEAAVKSMKYHLRRVTDGHILTVEELSTLLIEIEAMLNSRPICVHSSDEEDYLTPGHFLIGRPTTQVPCEDLTDVKISKLSRWQMLQQINQHIWKRWHLEYLTTLQQRNKWYTTKNNVKIGDIVLIKEDNLPPSKWLMGKIIELHPGSDGNIRVVTIKTTHGTIKRPVHKLCLLPVS